MAEVSFNFQNIVASQKCAVSSPRIVSLEIGDESPGSASESVCQEIFLNNQICHDDVKNKSSLICDFDKQSDKNSLIHSQFSLSTSTCDDRPLDKIKSTNDSDIDLDLLDLLNAADVGRAVESGAGKFNSKKTTSDDNMKIIPEIGVSGGLSDLLSSLAHDTPKKDENGLTFEYYGKRSTQDCNMGLLDFQIPQNEYSDSLSSYNSLKAEGNPSDLSTSIINEYPVFSKVENFDSRNMCYSKTSEKSEIKNKPSVSDISDLLSSIDPENSSESKMGSCDHNNTANSPPSLKVGSNLSDLLSSIKIENSNVTKFGSFNSKNICNSKVDKAGNKPPTCNLSDLLLSIDLGDSNKSSVASYNHGNMEILETKNEPCLADLLSSINIKDSGVGKQSSFNSKSACITKEAVKTKIENEPPITDLSDLLSTIGLGDSNDSNNDNFNCTDLRGPEINNESSFNDFIFDIGSGASSNSCASSYNSEKEHDSPKSSMTNDNLLRDKIFESESGYSSFDSSDKGFSFFDFSSDNQFSFNTLLTKKSDASTTVKHSDCKDVSNSNEEMSMSDLMTIVSPEFKNPVLASLNKTEKCMVNKGNASMQDLVESLNINDSNTVSNNVVECDSKLMNYDCVDGRISNNVHREIETVDTQDEQITFVDLRECVKSSEHQFTPLSPIKQNISVENTKLECPSPNKILFYHEDKNISDSSINRSNPFEFSDVVDRKKSKVNTKQTLFSKALACKPKKNHALLQKVANIKNELLNNIKCRPVLIDCEVPQPIAQSIVQSDRCILSKVGRKCFGLNASCDLL